MSPAPSSPVKTGGSLAPDAVSSLFQAVGGLRNYRAAAAMLGCFLVALVVMALVGAAGGGIGAGVLAGLVAVIVAFSGIHASGVLLMDQARGLPGRSISDAILYGVMCVPKTLALIVALVVVAISVYLLIALLFFVSKIPGLGPLLFAVNFPLSVLLAGATFTALFLGVFLSLAAIWQGATIGGALMRTLTILRHRLVETVLLCLVVGVLAAIVGGIVASILLTGFWPAAGIAMSVLGVSIGDMSGMVSIIGGSSFGRGAGAYGTAGLFGAGVLWALAMTLLMQVGLMGINLVYLRVAEGLDASATEDALRARMAEARRRAAGMKEKAKVAAETARAQAERAMEERRAASASGRSAVVAAGPAAGVPSPAATAPLEPAADPSVESKSRRAAVCEACGASVASGDLFCGHCGHRVTA